MKITVEFDSEEEFEAFRVSGKKTRTKKGDTTEELSQTVEAKAPSPIQPPTNGQAGGFPGTAGFVPPAGGAGPAGGGPFAPAAQQVAPEIQALVGRISTRVDATIAAGQPLEAVLQWFRGECGKLGMDANGADLASIKANFLPKMAQPVLENIAKLIAA
jgi:hypothetical protein